MLAENTGLIFWIDLCVRTYSLYFEAKIDEELLATRRRARPVLQQYHSPSGAASVDMVDVLDHSSDHPDWSL
jgi:hypothetical protein